MAIENRLLGLAIILTVLTPLTDACSQPFRRPRREAFSREAPGVSTAERAAFPSFWPRRDSRVVRSGNMHFEIPATPTGADNAAERFQILMGLIGRRLQQRREVDSVLNREDALAIRRLLERGRAAEAAPLIDRAFKGFQALISREAKAPKRTEHEATTTARGAIQCRVVDEHQQVVPGAVVRLFGTSLVTTSDEAGRFCLDDVPVRSPRYILTADKEDFLQAQTGNLAVTKGQMTEASLVLHRLTEQRACLQEKLAVKVGYILRIEPSGPLRQPDPGAVLDRTAYPKKVKPYLAASPEINCDHPLVQRTAREILAGVPESERRSQTIVAKAVYEWVVKNIEYDLVANYPGDPTCGNWQTTYGGWGRSFGDWCYTASQVIEQRRAICIEFERTASALLRALDIPARPAPLRAHPVTQWWVQPCQGEGYWANMETSHGRTAYRKQGDLSARFPSQPDHAITFWSIDAAAPIHVDWHTQQPCLWLEDYGSRASFSDDADGQQQAQAAFEEFARTGTVPGRRSQHGPPPLRQRSARLEAYSRGFVLDLANLGEQRTIVARFPEFANGNLVTTLRMTCWTNHPGWVVRQWTEKKENPETGEGWSFLCVEFDLRRQPKQSDRQSAPPKRTRDSISTAPSEDPVGSRVGVPDKAVGTRAGNTRRPTIRFPVQSGTVRICSALPAAMRGEEIDNAPKLAFTTVATSDGSVEIPLSAEPTWIVEGELSAKASPSPEGSPFGFHPANARGVGFDYAREIGVTWHRGGLYHMWILGQPDTASDRYRWDMFDREIRALPADMRHMKNICVCHDGMVESPGRRQLLVARRRSVDISQHVEGTTYRPKDAHLYRQWVKATVERYDGDGQNDMPGLKVPVRHWQVDNEPPRGRQGYADLVRITSTAIKEADPQAQVLVGGLVLPLDEPRRRGYEKDSLPILRDLAGKHIDIVDLHWFGNAGEWQKLPLALAQVSRDLHDCGFEDTAIWLTEVGTYSGKPADRRRRVFTFQSERQQASELVKRHVVALGEGVQKLFWAWGMIEGFIDVRDNDFFDNTALVYDGLGPDDPGRGMKKIAYWTYQRMTGLLAHWNQQRPQRLDLGTGVTAYRFQASTADGPKISIAWREASSADE